MVTKLSGLDKEIVMKLLPCENEREAMLFYGRIIHLSSLEQSAQITNGTLDPLNLLDGFSRPVEEWTELSDRDF